MNVPEMHGSRSRLLENSLQPFVDAVMHFSLMFIVVVSMFVILVCMYL